MNHYGRKQAAAQGCSSESTTLPTWSCQVNLGWDSENQVYFCFGGGACSKNYGIWVSILGSLVSATVPHEFQDSGVSPQQPS